LFFKPRYNQKLELSFSSLSEYRYGGEMVDEAAHLAKQSEERTHYVFMGGLDYQIDFNDENSSFILYMAGQKTDRDSGYVYGPGAPRNFYLGLRLHSF